MYSLALNEASFGALRKAQRILDRTHVDSDSDDGEGSAGSYSTEDHDSPDEESKQEDELRVKRPKSDAAIAARKGKNA